MLSLTNSDRSITIEETKEHVLDGLKACTDLYPLTFLAEDMHLSKPTVLSVADRWHTNMINAGTAP